MPLITKSDPEYYEILRFQYIQALKAKGMSKEEITEEIEYIRKMLESEEKV